MTGMNFAEAAGLQQAIADLAEREEVSIAVAESLTGGLLSSHLASAPGAATWFRGGIVSYHREVKYDLLGVPRGPVVSDVAARAMARGARLRLGSDLACAVTGVGGPKRQDDQPVGTVYLAVATAHREWADRFDFGDDTEQILRATVNRALVALVDALQGNGHAAG